MGTEMFHFPTFPPHTLFHSGAGNRTQLRLGSPIRTPPDHSSVANSPGLIAGSNVLHRLLMPRHPPCALHSLPNTNTQQKQQRHTLQNKHPHKHFCAGDARVHYSQTKQQEATKTKQTPTKGARVLMSQNPNSVLDTTPPTSPPPRSTQTPAPTRDDSCSTRDRQATSRVATASTTPLSEHHHDAGPRRDRSAPPGGPRGGCVLLRKEVIQPHLPVRLPCYDFVPIASPTFDHSLHKGWAVGFGCCRLS